MLLSKSFICTTCQKSFTQRQSLKKHIRLHTGERPFVCSFAGCQKSFAQNINLERHKRTHTGEKPFSCTICHKGFVSSSNLKQHQLIHKPEEVREKYACKFCDKTFLYAASIKKHVQLSHLETFKTIGKNSEPLYNVIKPTSTFLASTDKSAFSPAQQGLHLHVHLDSCGHIKIKHNGHIDYVHDGELHHVTNQGGISHHTLEVSSVNPSGCRPIPQSQCGKDKGENSETKPIPEWHFCNHESLLCECSNLQKHMNVNHAHSEICGHVPIRHGNHTDYLVNGRLHRPHRTHCDDHGEIEVVPPEIGSESVSGNMPHYYAELYT